MYNNRMTSALRVVICNPLTTWDIIERGLRAQLRVCGRVEREMEVGRMDLKWDGVDAIGLPWDL